MPYQISPEFIPYLVDVLEYKSIDTIVNFFGVVASICLIIVIIVFNLRQLKVTEGQLKATEKTAEVAYKTLLTNKYSKVAVRHINSIPSNSRKNQPCDFILNFFIQANIPTEIFDIRGTLGKEEKKLGTGEFPLTVSEVLKTIAITDIRQGDIGKSIDITVDYKDGVSEEKYRKNTHFLLLTKLEEDDPEIPFEVKFISEHTHEIA